MKVLRLFCTVNIAFFAVLVGILVSLSPYIQDFESFKTGDTWRNWSGYSTCKPKAFFQPRTEQEIIDVVKNASSQNLKVKVVGSSHSWMPIAATNDYLMNLDKYAAILDVFEQNVCNELNMCNVQNAVKLQAGIRIKDLNLQLASRGLALYNAGWIEEQSIGGAISTSTHGTGITLGSFSTQVLEMQIVTGKGEVLTLNKDKHPDIFNAARCGLGVIGIISTVTIQVSKAYNLQKHEYTANITDVLASLPKFLYEHRGVQFAWLPYTTLSTVQVFDLESSDENNFDPVEKVIKERLTSLLLGLEPLAPSIFMPLVHQGALPLLFGIGVHQKGKSYQLLPGITTDTWDEIEIFIPVEHLVAAHAKIRAFINGNSDKWIFNCLNMMRFIKGDDVWMSMTNGRDTVSLSFILYRQPEQMPSFAKALLELLAPYEARPHWGKIHHYTAKELRAVYPKFDDFNKVRLQVDPDGVFMNEKMTQLLVL